MTKPSAKLEHLDKRMQKDVVKIVDMAGEGQERKIEKFMRILTKKFLEMYYKATQQHE